MNLDVLKYIKPCEHIQGIDLKRQAQIEPYVSYVRGGGKLRLRSHMHKNLIISISSINKVTHAFSYMFTVILCQGVGGIQALQTINGNHYLCELQSHSKTNWGVKRSIPQPLHCVSLRRVPSTRTFRLFVSINCTKGWPWRELIHAKQHTHIGWGEHV